MNKIYPIIVAFSITALAYGASTEPNTGKKTGAQTKKIGPSPLSITSTDPASKLPITQMTAAILSISTPGIDIHPKTYVPGMPGMQFSDHSYYDHNAHSLYG